MGMSRLVTPHDLLAQAESDVGRSKDDRCLPTRLASMLQFPHACLHWTTLRLPEAISVDSFADRFVWR